VFGDDRPTAVSLFAGVGGIDAALERAGFRVVAAVEINPAARGVLRERFPDVALFDDVTEVSGDQLRAAGFVARGGLVAAGWPCQDFSVAGRRLGLGGARSGLWVQVDRLLAELRPAWFLGENVPGLLSAVCSCPGTGEHWRWSRPVDADDGDTDYVEVETPCDQPHPVPGGACGSGRCMELHGGAMGTVLGSLGERGYGFAYRVLDAQHFGVPQQRRRVYIVGHLGDRAAPVQVLLEPEGGDGDPAPGGTSRQGVAAITASSAGSGCGADDNDAQGGRLIASTLMADSPTSYRVGPDEATAGHLIATTLTTNSGASYDDQQTGQLIPFDLAQVTSGENRSNPRPGAPCPSLAATGRPYVAHALRADPGGTGQGHNGNFVAHTLTTNPQGGGRRQEDDYNVITHTLTADGADGADASEDGTGRGTPLVPMETAVRRLTPLECERLQGQPDGWTAVSDGRPQADSPRYRQIGNSVAVPVVEWIARRIVAVAQAMERAA
jgi:DNA (cytosine-5)-methyltransferase 1